MKVAAQSMGCGETKLRSSNKIFSGESEVKEKLLSAQVRHYLTSTRRTFSKLPKGRVQPTRDVLWCNQVISVLIAFISMPYIVLSKPTDFCVRSVGLGFLKFQFLMKHHRTSLMFCLFSIQTLGRKKS